MSLTDEFKERKYRRAYAESFANTVIATQIRLLRGTMTQKEFAESVGMKQSRISAMEDENYSAWSTKTLKSLAGSKDVVFVGRFMSFGELLEWSRHLSEDWLRVTPFDEDPEFEQLKSRADLKLVVDRFLAHETSAQGSLSLSPPLRLIPGLKPPSPRTELQSTHTELYGKTETAGSVVRSAQASASR